jgi:DAACS family dicarboxylate/amino acid:cation (Na+ or H+) symporter
MKPMALHTRILIGLLVGLVLGTACNVLLPEDPTVKWIAAKVAYPIGQIFLRLIFMIVIPLIFSALVLGVADLGDLRKIGRVGVKTLVFTVLVSAVSVFLGVGLVNLFQPGVGISEEARTALLETVSANRTAVTDIMTKAQESKSYLEALLDIIPRNPLADMVGAFDAGYKGGGLLAVMFFALCFGVAMAMTPSENVQVLTRALQGLYDVVMTVIGFAMRLAPFGVAALLFSTASQLGLQLVATLFKYVLLVLAGLALHQFVTYGIILRYAAGRSPVEFFRGIREVMLTALSTSSSNATLPTSIRVTNENLKVNPDITSFVLTVGSTANQNGTALYEGITVLFLAQFYGISLGLEQQFLVVVLSIVAGIGTAGVPGGSLPLVVLVLYRIGVPAEGIGVILGVDRILDMCRTVVNVTGDIALATWVDASEGRAAGAESRPARPLSPAQAGERV